MAKRNENFINHSDGLPELSKNEIDDIVSALEAGNNKSNRKKSVPGYLRPSDLTESGDALLFSSIYEDRLRWTKALGWMVWNGTQWLQDDAHAKRIVIDFTSEQIRDARTFAAVSTQRSQDGNISTEAKEYIKFANRMRSNSSTKAILELASATLATTANVFDSNPFLLNTPDGVIDLSDSSIRPHDPLLYCSKITGSGLGEATAEQNKLWQDFLDTITTEPESVQLSFQEPYVNRDIQSYLQKTIGSTIIGRVFHEGIQIAIGEGRNGKSTLYNAISKTLGEYAGSIDINTMTTDRANKGAAKATLRGKRFITCSELEDGQRLSTQTLKQLASTDPLTIEAKYKDPEEIEPSHHIVMLTNILPRIGSTDEGTWRRISIIPFKNRIPEDSSKANYAQTLFEKAGAAILAWVIEGARMFIADGCRIIPPAEIVAATNEYRLQEDWLNDFIENKCVLAADHTVRVGDLHIAYKKYCETIGAYARSRQEFNRALERRGFLMKTGHANKKYWIGLSLQYESPDAEFQKMSDAEWIEIPEIKIRGA